MNWDTLKTQLKKTDPPQIILHNAETTAFFYDRSRSILSLVLGQAHHWDASWTRTQNRKRASVHRISIMYSSSQPITAFFTQGETKTNGFPLFLLSCRESRLLGTEAAINAMDPEIRRYAVGVSGVDPAVLEMIAGHADRVIQVQ